MAEENSTPARKCCTVCGEVKTIAEFPLNRGRRLGRCKACGRKYWHDRYHTNPEARANHIAAATEWNRAHADKRLAKAAEKWRNDPGERVRRAANQRAAYPELRKDPAMVLRGAVSNGIRRAIGSAKARSRWLDIVGYTAEELRLHLERQFAKGMSWANYGEWHIDHIVPLASFDFSEDPIGTARTAWALTNIRPLWQLENRRKHAKITHLL